MLGAGVNRAQAWETIGGLGKAGKMPCSTFGLPAGAACGVGSVLVNVPGSTCFGCYANNRGSYAWGSVKCAQARREGKLGAPSGSGWAQWVRAFVKLLGRQSFFRWHDSGDVRSYAHLLAIVRIAERLPHVRFWLPTREYGIVRRYLNRRPFPQNLTVRISAAMNDSDAPATFGLPTSRVHDAAPPVGAVCPAPSQGGKCGDCRACWDPAVPVVSYAKH